MVGVTGDLIDEYLARLRASLRTAPERTAEILAEAEDHLRESAAAGETLGLSEREAQETAIAAFGPVKAVVRAHRRPACAIAAEAGMGVWKIAAVYLLTVAGVGALLWILFYRSIGIDTAFPAVSPHHVMFLGSPPDHARQALNLGGCAVAGLVLLTGYLATRRFRLRRGQAPVLLLGGYFPLAAAMIMLIACPVVLTLTATLIHPPGWTGVPGLALVAGAMVVALGYTGQMVLTMIRQGRDGETDMGTTDGKAHYA